MLVEIIEYLADGRVLTGCCFLQPSGHLSYPGRNQACWKVDDLKLQAELNACLSCFSCPPPRFCGLEQALVMLILMYEPLNFSLHQDMRRQVGGIEGHTKVDSCPDVIICLLVQVAHLELLAKLYIKRFNYEHAAGVYEALAERRSGVSDQAISLADRQEAYQNAVLQVSGALLYFIVNYHRFRQVDFCRFYYFDFTCDNRSSSTAPI